MEDEQWRLDPLGTVDRGSAAVQLGLRWVVRGAHHPLQVEASGAVAVAVALGNLRVAEQVDAGPPRRGLLDERRQHEYPPYEPPKATVLPIRPRLFGRPPRCIDHIVDVRVAPLAVVGSPERAPVTGRAA